MQLSTTTSFTTSPIQSQIYLFNNLSPTSFLHKSLFLSKPTKTLQNLYSFQTPPTSNSKKNLTTLKTSTINASLLEAPLLWAGRLCVYYALLKAGLAGSQANPLVSVGDLGFSRWLENIQGQPDKEAADKEIGEQMASYNKGYTEKELSKSKGRRLLKAISSLLSDDDHFTDAYSHKSADGAAIMLGLSLTSSQRLT